MPPVPQPSHAGVTPPAPQPNKAFTNATVPAPAPSPKKVPEDKYIPDSEINAKALSDPDFINLKPKNKSMAFFWGNRAVGDKESKMRVNQLSAKGFVFVKPQDCEGWDADPNKSTFPDSLIHENRIINGDLILMMMKRVDYIGSQKYNAQTASLRVRKFGIITRKDDEGNVTETSALPRGLTNSPKAQGKVALIVPDTATANALTGASSDGTPNI